MSRAGSPDLSQKAADQPGVTAAIEPRNRRREWPRNVRRARRSGSPRRPSVTALQDVVHLGDQATVSVPPAEFLRLRLLESTASAEGSKMPRTPPPSTRSFSSRRAHSGCARRAGLAKISVE